MQHTSRRHFLKTAALAPFAFHALPVSKKKQLRLSFSTLGCPDWPFEKVLNFAAQHGYSGIELRGILRELDLTKRPEFDTPEHIRTTKAMVAEKRLKIVDLGSSAALHISESSERQKNLDGAKRFIDLAQQLDCPFVRVFPNELPKTSERARVIDLITAGLIELGTYAKGSNVAVLLESHGDAVQTAELRQMMEAAASPNTGLLWDVVNMWAVTKEAPAAVYGQLKKFIRHTHLKDLQFGADGKEHYVRFGTGVAPIFEAVDALHNDGYNGYYSFEWEKLWHPEIEDPEAVLAEFPRTMAAHFKKL